jgi:hypothetical protein
MEPAAAYLYTVAMLGMTFIGFSAVVMLVRQTLGRRLRPFDALFARVYMEFGLMVSTGALMPPLLTFWELPPAVVWRVASGLMGVPLLVFALTYPARRRAAAHEATPLYVYLNVSFLWLVSLAFLAVMAGMLPQRSPAMFVTALTLFMVFAVGAWLRAFGLILASKTR